MNRPDYRSVLIQPSLPCRDIYRLMNDTALMIGLVTDGNGTLLGTVTDGDIRRGLLKGLSLETPAERVMNPHPITVLSGTPRAEILTLMNLHRITQIPLLDERGRVVGLELLTDLFKSPEKVATPVVIFAGGFGKRLRPLTAQTPKPMLPVGGRPLIELIIGRLAAQGFHDFHLAVHYKKEVIRRRIGDGHRLGVGIRYIQERKPLGTVGAVRLAADQFKEPILIVNGDVLTAVDFRQLLKFHQTGGQQLTIALKSYFHQVPFGVVKLEGELVVDLEEKPSQTSFVNAGIYVVDPMLLPLIPAGQPFDMPDFIRSALAKGYRVAGFPMHEYWLDIGSRGDYDQANIGFRRHFKGKRRGAKT